MCNQMWSLHHHRGKVIEMDLKKHFGKVDYLYRQELLGRWSQQETAAGGFDVFNGLYLYSPSSFMH